MIATFSKYDNNNKVHNHCKPLENFIELTRIANTVCIFCWTACPPDNLNYKLDAVIRRWRK